jgi:hypothetical protein
MDKETAEALNQNTEALASHLGALTIILIDKGICTVEELEKARLVALHETEQAFAKKRDKT